MSHSSAVEDALRRLYKLTAYLIIVGFFGVMGFSVFAIYEVRQFRQHQQQLHELTESLCVTLGRAGIILEGTREDPCEQLPR